MSFLVDIDRDAETILVQSIDGRREWFSVHIYLDSKVSDSEWRKNAVSWAISEGIVKSLVKSNDKAKVKGRENIAQIQSSSNNNRCSSDEAYGENHRRSHDDSEIIAAFERKSFDETLSGENRKKQKSHPKKKKNKKKSGGKTSLVAPSSAAQPSKIFRFGTVQVIECTREVGGCGIPSDGTWGLSLSKGISFTLLDINDFEMLKADRLCSRALQLSKKNRQLCHGETRQWDHKRESSGYNPLFRRLVESERRDILLEYLNVDNDTGSSLYDIQSEFVTDAISQVKDLDKIRHSRSTSGGCSCFTITNVDKLSLQRIKEELQARNLNSEGSKNDLSQVLRKVVGKNLCTASNCECLSNGIQCQADVCRCCTSKKHSCANPLGLYSYKASRVDQYRAPYITAKIRTWDTSERNSAGCSPTHKATRELSIKWKPMSMFQFR